MARVLRVAIIPTSTPIATAICNWGMDVAAKPSHIRTYIRRTPEEPINM